MASTILCSCSSNAIFRLHSVLFLPARKRIIKPNLATVGVKRSGHNCQTRHLSRRFFLFAANQGSTNSSESNESVPSWARPDSDEPPPWACDEGKDKSLKQSLEAPFYVYLLASAITAIAAIGSVFEYVNQRPVFGILNADSIFYTPLLGFFAFTGIPTSAFLWFKSVQAANKEAEEQDRRDGYL